jgi:Fe-S cluster assembly protein SufD
MRKRREGRVDMADIHSMRTAAETALVETYGSMRDALPGSDETRALRDTAFAGFRESGLPHRRIEDWKYTDLRTLMREAKPLAPAPDSLALDRARRTSEILREHAHLRLTLVDGSFAPSLSDVGLLPAGVRLMSLAEALAANHPLVVEKLGLLAPENAVLQLNAAFMTDGVVVTVDDGVVVELPLLLQSVHARSAGEATYTRSLIVLGKCASLTLVDAYEGPAGVANQTNAAIEVHLGEGARLERVSLQAESLQTLHLSTVTVSLGNESSLRSFALVAGGAVARNQLFINFAGENAKALLTGATILAGRRHADTSLVVDHAAPGGQSRELYKAVLDGETRSVFQGKIIVRPGAQKTDGRMMTNAILLSDEAEADNKPELEIFADDVQCGHGATCGALDEDLLFYCRSRGLPEAEARAILIQAFLGETIETVESEALRQGLNRIVERWLAEGVSNIPG